MPDCRSALRSEHLIVHFEDTKQVQTLRERSNIYIRLVVDLVVPLGTGRRAVEGWLARFNDTYLPDAGSR